MTSRTQSIAITAAILGGMLLCGCAPQKTGPEGTSASDRATQLNQLQQKRQDFESSLKAMSNDKLVLSLAPDAAKAREPFNSAAYREIVSRGSAAAPALKSQLKSDDRTSLLALLALRQVDPATYRTLQPAYRVSVLVDALKNAKYFNVFGIPNMYWEEAAKAIIDEGPAASEPLTALLRDTRLAPVFGSEGASINQQYHYRVCDYAWALLSEIRHQKVTLAATPAERDKQIDQ